MINLMPVTEALEHILAAVEEVTTESLPLTQSLNRVLAQNIQSEINLPPFPNSSMDGYALRSANSREASSHNPVQLRVIMDIPAGYFPDHAIADGEAARIMTGAPVPQGADAVIPVEDTDTHWKAGQHTPLVDAVTIVRPVGKGEYVRPIGENVQKNMTVLLAGTRLQPQDIGILVAIGITHVTVYRRPRICILTSG